MRNRLHAVDSRAPTNRMTGTMDARRDGGGGEHTLTLDHHIDNWANGAAERAPVAAVVRAIARTAIEVAALIARGPLAGELGKIVGDNADGDAQKALDLQANDLFLAALRQAPVALFASEENDQPIRLDADAPLAVAIDPLDGSSNIDTNISIGTIFSILPMADDQRAVFLQPGARQLAAGFVVYGPQTTLVLTLGRGTMIFTLDRQNAAFVLTRRDVTIPEDGSEYAINASNYRHWDDPIRNYIDDCVAGADGPYGKNFNMRWIASLVAEAFRILARGGIFLYPGDARPGYGQGRLRLVYEANPLALIVEQAGGAAIDGQRRILDLTPSALHQRVPLVFGSRAKVERVARYHREPPSARKRSPLFGERGLFQVR